MSAGDAGADWRCIHRIVLPGDGIPDGAARLYLRAEGPYTLLDRRTLALEPGSHADFGTYFGAFPSVNWIAEANIDRVRLSVDIDGAARVRISGTDASGRVHQILAGTASGQWVADVVLDERSAGWLWFAVEAVDHVVIRNARWSVPEPSSAPRASSASIAITTFDRNDDCVDLIRRLASDPELQGRIVQVVVADQGTRPIRDHPGFVEASSFWGERLRVIEQDNIGGSGGFSRGMIEALDTSASHVLLLDDDVSLEPESVLRMLSLADHAHDEPLIGAHMLRLTAPTQLHSWGEKIDRRRFWWAPVEPALSGVDVAINTPDRTPAMSARYSVDFNGWWMCLIPTSAIRRVGAALPLFIKWDDAEYALRATGAGHRTVTLPGAAIWHMPWTAKDDGLDWQAYYQLRNRLVAALAHSSQRRGGGLLREMFGLDVNHILCLQYGSASVRQLAVADVLSGPEHLVPSLRTRPFDIRARLRDEGQTLRPQGSDLRVLRAGAPVAPKGTRSKVGRLLRVLSHQLRTPGHVSRRSVDASETRVEIGAVFLREEGKWWSLGLEDRAFLRGAAGTEGFLLRRDRRRAARLLGAAVRSTLLLWWRWPELARRYRDATPGLADPETWEGVFENS